MPNINFQGIKKLLAVFVCVVIVAGYAFLTGAVSPAKIQFTADTIISLSGISDGDLYAAQNSEADSVAISGSTLTVGDIPAGSSFILKTAEHDNALKITPAGGVLDLTFASDNLSSGNIIQWTLNATSGTTVTHIVGVPLANTWYAVKTDGIAFNSYKSDASSEVSFNYNGGFSTKIFTIEQTTAPSTGGGGLPPEAYNSPIPPVPGSGNSAGEFKVSINNGAAITDSLIVNLRLYAGSDTKKMAISETQDFKNAIQEDYSFAKIWTFSGCYGIKTIYAKFYTQYGVSSEIVSDNIVYKMNSSQKEFLARVPNDLKVYLINDNKKQWIKTAEDFISRGYAWDKILTVAPEQLSCYPDNSNFSSSSQKNTDVHSYLFLRNLKTGDRGSDIKELQKFLNKTGFIVALEGAGSLGKETELFGSLTKKSLIKFQEAHFNEILRPLGLANGTGIFGNMTRAYVNAGR